MFSIEGGEHMLVLSDYELQKVHGKAITAAAIIGYVMVAAAVAGIIKILTSSKGRVSLGSFTMTWG